MKSIKIKFIKEGMVTATEVKDRMGRTLLTEGQVITAQKLKTLKAWGVTDANIKDSKGSDEVVQEVDKIIASPAIIKEQETLFKHTDRRHPAIAELYDICLARKVEIRQDNYKRI